VGAGIDADGETVETVGAGDVVGSYSNIAEFAAAAGAQYHS
jgi:hypothetical protein